MKKKIMKKNQTDRTRKEIAYRNIIVKILNI